MRILHVIASVDPAGGGPIEGILRQGETTPFQAHHREIATLDPLDAPYLRDFPMPVHALGEHAWKPGRTHKQEWLPWRRYRYSNRFVRWLRANAQRYDVVVVNGLWNFTTLGWLVSGRGQGVPYVVFTHGQLDPWFRRTYPLKGMLKQLFWLFADGPVFNGASAVLFTTEEERLLAKHAFWPYRPRERLVAYGSGDAPDGKAEQRAALSAALPGLRKPFLLFLSRIHPKKGCDLLIDSFSQIASQHPYIDLVIAGPDESALQASLEGRVTALGLAGRVHWPGMLMGAAKWGAFRAAEAFILPSHSENFGIVVAEAMACGTPVLISNKVNIWREVEASGGGLVEDDTVQGTHRLLQRFLALSQLERGAMSSAARRCYEDRFSAEAAAVDLIRVLEDIVAERGRT